MLKDKAKILVDYMIKHSKIAFPVVVIAAVAVTVSVALNMGKADKLEKEGLGTEATDTAETTDMAVEENVSMVLNENPDIANLINSYYTGMTNGDADTLNSVCDEISLQDMLGYQEKSKYIERYTSLEIYTKQGLEADSVIAFVYYKVVFADHPEEFPGYSAHYICKDEQGNLYIKRSDFTDEQDDFLGKVFSQEDVVEFNNRVTVEYNELMVEHPELLEYLSEMDAQVKAAVGVGLAGENADASKETEAAGTEENPGTEGNAEAEGDDAGAAQTPAEDAVQYATASTTVNVRSSDSEKADKLGKVSGGEKLQVLEQKQNGWTKVVYEGKDGYIKSEFLTMVESAEGAESIGTVTATTNINVRSSASETAERLGVLAGGDSAELLAKEDGWCKIKYNGKVGYVKAEYVQ